MTVGHGLVDEKRSDNAPKGKVIGRPFVAGNKAAVGHGRPRTHEEMRELCRGHTETIILKWLHILLKGPPNAANRAGENLMAYGWGKPVQPLTGEDGAGSPLAFVGAHPSAAFRYESAK